MPQNLWILPLKASDGRMRGTARIMQSGAQVTVELRSQMPDNAFIYLLCTDGPILLKNNTAKLTGAITGLIVMHDGKCILEARRRGVKINMEQEKMRLRLLATPNTSSKSSAIQQPAVLTAANPASVPMVHSAPTVSEPPASDLAESTPVPPSIISAASANDPPAKSEALQNILQQARVLFPAPDTAVYPSRLPQANDISPQYVKKPPFPTPPVSAPTPKISIEPPPSALIPNPFPNTFPRSVWQRVLRSQGQGWYLKGDWMRGEEHIEITAVPGDYRPIPPRHLQGFSRYIKTLEGGYWVRLRRGIPQ